MNNYFKIIFFCIFLIVNSCASTHKAVSTSIKGTGSIPQTIAENKTAYVKKNKLIELPLLQLEEKVSESIPEKMYTLSARDTDIKSILMGFAKESDLSIVIDPDVQGTVTIDLKEVTLEKALSCLLYPLKLEYKIDGKVLNVFRRKKITRIFNLDYIATVRTGNRSFSAGSGVGGSFDAGGQRVLTGGESGSSGGQGGSSGSDGGGNLVGGGGGGSSSVAGSDFQDIFSEIEKGLRGLGLVSEKEMETTATIATSNSATPVVSPGSIASGQRNLQLKNLSGSLENLLPKVSDMVNEQETSAAPVIAPPVVSVPEEGETTGVFSIIRQSGTILVTTYSDIMEKVAMLLETIEGTIQRQVFIRAKILEVTLNDEFDFGINWNAIFSIGSPNVSVGQTIPESIEGFFNLNVTTMGFSSVLNALTKQGTVNVLSSPTISTLNNQTAIVKVGRQDVFFQTTSDTTSTSGAVTTTSTSVPIPITIGVILDVTPQISSDGMITMNIHPSITELAGVATSRFGDTAPILSVRETDTVVRVKEGETIVIAGLMSDSENITKNKTPILGSLPGLNALFSSTEHDQDKTDLVILLSPAVLTGKRMEDLTIEELNRLELAKNPKYKWYMK